MWSPVRTNGTDLLAASAVLERLVSGFIFAEGPVWHPTEQHLLFSDVPASVRWRWSRPDGARIVRAPAEHGNGLAYDDSLALIVCEHETSSVVRERPDGRRETLASHWNGQQLNSPNDVIVAQDGSIYFTDPSYGRRMPYGPERGQALDFQGVYRITPSGQLELLMDDFEQPNGLCLSPAQDRLYVNDTARREIRCFAARPDGSLSTGDVFFDGIGRGADDDAPDGMKCDVGGNVYCTGPGGIWVIDGQGNRLGAIAVPETVGNFAFGGRGRRSLYITATSSIYRVTPPDLATGGRTTCR